MICCLGVGPGDLDFLTRKGHDLIERADVVAGFTAVVDLVRSLVKPNARVITMGYKDQVDRLREVADLHRTGSTCVVVFMGDPHFSGFQFLERVEQACQHHVEAIPGISSAQILASRCRICFDETTFITFHRRGEIASFQKHLVHVLEDSRNAIVIPRPWDFMPAAVASYLTENGISPDHPTEVWEHLTQSEAVWKGRLGECASDFSDMSIMLIRACVGDAATPRHGDAAMGRDGELTNGRDGERAKGSEGGNVW
jgi:cobalt-precorrin-7 (C5)-methyltransferase